VYISYSKDGQRIGDSSDVKDGKYAFKGSLPEPTLATLRISYLPLPDGSAKPMSQQRDIKPIFISSGKIQVSSVDSFSNISVKGSPANDEWVKLNAQMKPLNDKVNDLNRRWTEYNKEKNTEGTQKIEEEFAGIENEINDIYKNYVEANPGSPIAPFVVGQYAGYIIDADKAQPLFDKLSPEAKKLPSSVALAGRIDRA